MRILVVGDFDPCAVHLRQRKWLAPLGIEVRLAMFQKYWPEHDAVDWFLPRDAAEVGAYANTVDLLVFLPNLQQPWSSQTTDLHFEEIPVQSPAPKLFLIHGSYNAAPNMVAYAEHYKKLGTVAAPSLEYAAGMQCMYIPNIVDVTARAALRGRGDTLKVNHSPSDTRVCSSDWFRSVVAGRGQMHYVHGKTHEESITAKSKAHLGFDHLRGAFSLNSLENSAVGLVNLVGISDASAELGASLGVTPDWPKAQCEADVVEWLDRFKDDWALTAKWQRRCYDWSQANWTPPQIAKRIADCYRAAAA